MEIHTNLFRTLTVTAGATALGLAMMAPKPAEACGGLFCSNIPVNQTEEAIIFDVDVPNNEVTAIINIFYQGSAPEFAWLLPLQAAPDAINVGSTNSFIIADQLTRPQFQITKVEDVGVCSGGYWGYGYGEDADLASAGGPPQAPNDRGGVEVVSRQDVGPYDTVVLSGTDPEAIREWLVDNGFRVTDEMMEVVVPYIAQGDVLLALKLLNDKDAGDVQPIEVTMRPEDRDVEACVPIRLTSIAAAKDMPITIYVLTDEGRAIPENFFHVEPNLLKIDWLSGGSNYRQLIAQAVDEADAGHAFVTEYSGTPSIFENTIYQDGQYDTDSLRQHRDLGDFLQDLQNQGLNRRAGVQNIIAGTFPALADCRGCQPGDFAGQPVTEEQANAVASEIEERVVAPDRRAQELMDKRSHFTRLLTMLDPDEMTVDPIFAYDSSLDPVSNVHTASMIRDCGVGGTPGSAGITIVLEDGRSIAFESNGYEPDRTVIDAMPAAARIDQLYEGITVRDNTVQIEDALDDHNSRNGQGGCGAAKHAKGSVWSSFALAAFFGLAFLSRRRRK